MDALPIDPLLPEIVATLGTTSRLVLRAPPGAGKTTRVPTALLDAGLAGSKHVIVLEPRRIAARAAAEFVAAERGCVVGDAVGYRVRFEQRGSEATRLWFVTEGVLGRRLISDPFLEQVGVVVLDEFHERHLQGDVALAVIRELQSTVRPDLKLVVMSATLQTEPLAAYLDGCPVLTSLGRTYPVHITYMPDSTERPLPVRITSALRHVLGVGDDGGDVLIFLPGAAEIRRAAAAIEPLATERRLTIVALHGDMPLEAQQQAIRRGTQRKVVLSTNVAETALTIDGVTTVIDSGLAREARFDARHGLNALRVVAISQAAAEQRAGRAGRTAPGHCVRLWSPAEQQRRRPHEAPEVLRLDLSGVLLELRAWGLREISQFHWLDTPGTAAIERAEQLLKLLGAIDGATGAVTSTGRRMLEHSLPPRLARLLVEADQRGCANAGALVAALASERDICLEARSFGAAQTTRWPSGASDLLQRLALFEAAERHGFDRGVCTSLGLDTRAARSVARARQQLVRRGRPVRRLMNGVASAPATDPDILLRCILVAFPDRVVRRRAPGSPRGVMVGGRGIVLADTSVVRDAELFVAVDVDTGPRRQLAEARVRIASAIERSWLEEMVPAASRVTSELIFDSERERVVERVRQLFYDLVIDEKVGFDVDPRAAGEILAEVARLDPAHAARIGEAERRLVDRIGFLQRWMPELQLTAKVGDLLTVAIVSLCPGRHSFAELRDADVPAALRGLLSPAQRRALERDAPEYWLLPSGRRAPIAYYPDKAPTIAARIQELFGLTATPRLAGGRVKLVLQVLAPNQRPVQITDDLESFWQHTYPEVRKLLRGRYPKHAWPEDPFSALPRLRR